MAGFDERMIVRCTGPQKVLWEAAAAASGTDVSKWIRDLLDEAAERETGLGVGAHQAIRRQGPPPLPDFQLNGE